MSANFLIIGCGAREISIFRNLKKNVQKIKYFFMFLMNIRMFMENQMVIKFLQVH